MKKSILFIRKSGLRNLSILCRIFFATFSAVQYEATNENPKKRADMPDKPDHPVFPARRVPADAPTLTFTGHRPDKLAGYDRAAYRDFTEQLADLLFENYYEHGYRRFITGGAQGFDQLAFWAVEKMKKAHSLKDVENVLYVPFSGQDRRWKETGTFSRDDYRKMRKFADREVVLVPCATTKGEVVAALMGRNREMVNASDRVLALCNSDSWREDSGGTAACMRYAESKHVPIDRAHTAIEDDGSLRIAAFEAGIA